MGAGVQAGHLDLVISSIGPSQRGPHATGHPESAPAAPEESWILGL